MTVFTVMKRYIILMLVIVGHGSAYAENDEDTLDILEPPVYLSSPISESKIPEDEPFEEDSFLDIFWRDATVVWMDETHQEVSSNVASIGTYIDSLMGNVENIQDLNESYLKIVFAYYDSKHGSRNYEKSKFEPRVRFRLDLPVLKEKLHVVFETEPDQTKDISERKLSSFPSSNAVETETNDDIYASFQYLFEAEKWKRLTWDTGVKLRVQPDAFTRGRAVRYWDIFDAWNFRYAQELFWFESRGLGTHTQFDFDRRLSDRFLFRKTIALDWSERASRFDLLNQVSLFHTFNEKRSMHYAIGVRSEREKYHVLVSNYFSKVVFRSSLYKKWLFYQIETGLEFPRSSSFDENPFVGIKLEILFADDAVKRLNARLD